MSTRLLLHEVGRVSRIENLVSLGFDPMWKRLFLTLKGSCCCGPQGSVSVSVIENPEAAKYT